MIPLLNFYYRELAMNAKMIVQMDGKKTRIFNTKVSRCSNDSQKPSFYIFFYAARTKKKPLLIKVKHLVRKVYYMRTIRNKRFLSKSLLHSTPLMIANFLNRFLDDGATIIFFRPRIPLTVTPLKRSILGPNRVIISGRTSLGY